MIRIVRVILAFMVFINFSSCQASENQSQANTQTELSQETIRSNIPGDVKKEIEGLSSTLGVERVSSAIKLGKMGEKAEPAIPFLIKLLNDFHSVTTKTTVDSYSGIIVLESSTSVSEQAREALSRIGEAALEPLIAALADSLAKIRISAAAAV